MSAFGVKVDQSYLPELNKNKERIETAIKFVLTRLPIGKARSLARTELVAAFGDYSIERRKLAVLLKFTLITTVDGKWSIHKEQCKQYTRNQSGVDYWSGLIGNKHSLTWRQWKELHQVPEQDEPQEQGEQNTGNQVPSPSIICGGRAVGHLYAIPDGFQQQFNLHQQQFQSEFQSQQFKMKLTSNRFYHSLHKECAEYKAFLFAQIGLPYIYDIEVAKLTLLVQFAKKNGLVEPTPTLDEHIVDKTLFRKYAQSFQLSEKTSPKDLLNAMISDRCSHYTKAKALPKCFMYRTDFYQFIKNPMIVKLEDELDLVWNAIKPVAKLYLQSDYPKTKQKQNDTSRRGKVLSAMYTKLERTVMDVVEKHIRKTRNKWFREHDGFNCKKQIDTNLVEQMIHNSTGYSIKLVYKPNPYHSADLMWDGV